MIRAFHWRGAPDEAAAERGGARRRRRARGRGLRVALGPQGARGPPAGRDGQGPRRGARCCATPTLTAALYVGDDRTDVDAFGALRDLGRGGAWRHALCVGVRSDETPAELAGQADLLVDGPTACARCSNRSRPEQSPRAAVRFVDLLKTTVHAARRAPRRRWRSSPSPPRRSGTRRLAADHGGRLVADRRADRRLRGPPGAGHAADRAAAGRRARRRR